MSTKALTEAQAVFQSLKSIFVKYGKSMQVISDLPGKYYLQTREAVYRGKPVWFGGVEIKKNYVSFHLIPIYMFPDLKKAMSLELQKRMQGKSCFNFKKPDPELFAELEALTAVGVAQFRKMDWSKLPK
jgi:hypothetical protein